VEHCGKCAIYQMRPKACQEFPKLGDALPTGCTYSFDHNGTRHGTCDSTSCLENSCCNFPRAEGAPDGEKTAEERGGLPCRHLEWVDIAKPKVAAAPASTVDSTLYTDAHRLIFGE
jgi:hypothetical protein